MRKKIYHIIILFTFFTSLKILAQNDVKLSSFFLTPLTYNPAYAGSYEGISFTSLYSSQWVGFDGAPKTLFMNGHGTVFGPNTGIGAEIIHDEIGFTTDTKILGNYAYHVRLNKDWEIALGIKTGASWYSINYNRFRIQNPNEFNIFEGDINNINVNFGAGFLLYNDNFFIGLGVPNFLKNIYFDSYNSTLANSRANYYFSSGYKFNLTNQVYLQPSLLLRVVNGAPINTMLAGTLNWQEKLYLSLNLDFNSTIGGFAGFRVYKNYLIGYSYDASINRFSNSNRGIHSFFLNIRLEDYWQRKRCSCYSF